MKTKKFKKADNHTLSTIRNAMKACRKRGINIVAGKWGTTMDEKNKSFVIKDSTDKSVCALGA